MSNNILVKGKGNIAKITVDARCCAGVTEETHLAALTAMKCCQIDVAEV